MRKILLSALILFAIISCHKTNTPPAPVNPTPTPGLQDTLNAWVKSGIVSANLQDVWFNDQNNGILAAATGLLSSGDGGKTWVNISNTSGLSAFNIQFLDSLNGFVQGDHQLGETSDGGKTWSVKPLTSQAIYFQFISTTAGFYFNRASGIYSTHNGGDTWTSSLAATRVNQAYPFYFLDSLTGFTMTDGNFSKTTDGGAHWQLVTSNVSNLNYANYYRMQFLDALNGYCATPNGLLKTTDGGKTWLNCLATTPALTIPQFFDVSNGYCLVKNTIFKTTDGGKNWTTSCKLPNDQIFGIHFLDMNTGWACTSAGYVLSLKL